MENKKAVIGSGSWGIRLSKILNADNYQNRYGSDLTEYDEIYVAIPSVYLDNLKKFKVRNPAYVFVCTKGLYKDGNLPSVFIKKIWNIKTTTLGGPNIEGNEILLFGGKELEIAGILKNVYAIAYGGIDGENKKAMQLALWAGELLKKVKNEQYLADLFVTCMSKKSRNSTFGKTGKMLKGQVVEGYHTAQIIKKYDIFADMIYLREICNDINRIAGH